MLQRPLRTLLLGDVTCDTDDLGDFAVLVEARVFADVINTPARVVGVEPRDVGHRPPCAQDLSVGFEVLFRDLRWVDLVVSLAAHALGFEPAGSQREVRLHFGDTRPDPAVRRARVGDLPDILALHEQKPLRVRRDLAAMALALSAENMETMVLHEAGTLRAYACLGKGQDFGGWWHELGGCDTDVRRLLSAAMALLGRDTATVLVPPYRGELVAGAQPPPAACALALPWTAPGRDRFFVDGLDSI